MKDFGKALLSKPAHDPVNASSNIRRALGDRCGGPLLWGRRFHFNAAAL